MRRQDAAASALEGAGAARSAGMPPAGPSRFSPKDVDGLLDTETPLLVRNEQILGRWPAWWTAARNAVAAPTARPMGAVGVLRGRRLDIERSDRRLYLVATGRPSLSRRFTTRIPSRSECSESVIQLPPLSTREKPPAS